MPGVESFVQVTSGAGPKLHTNARVIGANTVEDEIVVVGEPYLSGYVAPFGAALVSTATANSHLGQIMAGAALKVRIRRIQIFQMGLATAAAFAQLILVRLTTAGTGGTTSTVNPLDTGAPAAGAAAMTLPTVKGAEGVTLWSGSGYFMQTAGASTPAAQPIVDIDFDKLRIGPIIIPAGATNGLAIKNVTAIAAATVAMTVWLDESNF